MSRKLGWWHLLGDVDATEGLLDSDAVTPESLEFGSAASVRAAVLAGAGPAVMSRLAVADDLAQGRLSAVAVEGVDWRRTFRAIWVGERTPRPARYAISWRTSVTNQTCELTTTTYLPGR